MILRVTRIEGGKWHNDYEHKPTVKYYEPSSANKEKIKNDFGLRLDAEIKKLTIDYII